MYGVIDAAFLALEGGQDGVKAAVVTISGREESLRWSSGDRTGAEVHCGSRSRHL